VVLGGLLLFFWFGARSFICDVLCFENHIVVVIGDRVGRFVICVLMFLVGVVWVGVFVVFGVLGFL